MKPIVLPFLFSATLSNTHALCSDQDTRSRGERKGVGLFGLWHAQPQASDAVPERTGDMRFSASFRLRVFPKLHIDRKDNDGRLNCCSQIPAVPPRGRIILLYPTGSGIGCVTHFSQRMWMEGTRVTSERKLWEQHVLGDGLSSAEDWPCSRRRLVHQPESRSVVHEKPHGPWWTCSMRLKQTFLARSN